MSDFVLTPEERRLIESKRHKEQEKLDSENWTPRMPADYTDKEKIEAFEHLHSRALRHFNDVKQNHFQDDDAKNYIWEDVMELLSPKEKQFRDVWWAYNQFLR